MLDATLKKIVGDSAEKSYRQIKIVQGKGEEKIKFVMDIKDGDNEVEKMEQLFDTLMTKMQELKFYEENK